MRTKVLVASAIAGAFGLGWWIRPVAQPNVSIAARHETEAKADQQLTLLRRCADRLDDLSSRSPADDDDDSTASRSSPSVGACLADPRVRAELEARLRRRNRKGAPDDAEPLPVETDGSSAKVQLEVESGSRLARGFATRVVGTSQDESEWLERYMCIVDRLRTQMLDDLEVALDADAPAEELDAIVSRAHGERDAALKDVESYLGPERYARLRSVGGLGILGAALDCSAQ